MPLESKECCSFLSKERESSGNNNNNKISSFFPSGYRTHHNNGLDLLETTLARSHSASSLGGRERSPWNQKRRERPFLHIFATANSSSKGGLHGLGGQLRPAASSILRWHQCSRLIISTYYEYKYPADATPASSLGQPSDADDGLSLLKRM